MTNALSNTLVLAGTGKTGSRVAVKLIELGLRVRTAARNGADVRFDWDDLSTHSPALADIDRVYLVAPVLRTGFAGHVSSLLDLAQAAGVRHVTYISAFGFDQVPPQWVAHRAVELDLIGRGAMTHSILRPAWFMQNFSETFLKPVDGVIAVPTGDGAEAFAASRARERVSEAQRCVRRRKSARPNVTGWPTPASASTPRTTVALPCEDGIGRLGSGPGVPTGATCRGE